MEYSTFKTHHTGIVETIQPHDDIVNCHLKCSMNLKFKPHTPQQLWTASARLYI